MKARPLPQLMINGIMFAVLVWGACLAMGAFLFNFDFRKGLIVYGAVILFLVCWSVLLSIKSRKDRNKEQDERLNS